MEYLVRTASVTDLTRTITAIERLPNHPIPAAEFADQIHPAVFLALIAAAHRNQRITIPRDHYDEITNRLYAYRTRRTTSERSRLSLIDTTKSPFYRRGTATVPSLTSVAEAQSTLDAYRRRETKLLTGLVTGSIPLGTALILGGGIIESIVVLGGGIAILIGIIPVAVTTWQYFRGAKDTIAIQRDRLDAKNTTTDYGDRPIHVEPT